MIEQAISLSTILVSWLKTKPIKAKFKFFVDTESSIRMSNRGSDMLRCKKCRCFEAFIGGDKLYLRLAVPDYKTILASDPNFLTKLKVHLTKHKCEYDNL